MITFSGVCLGFCVGLIVGAALVVIEEHKNK